MRHAAGPTELDRAVAALAAGDVASAEKLARRLVKRAPHHPAVLHLAGLVARHRGRDQEAVRLLQRAAKVEHRNPDLLHNLGACLMACRRWAEAREAFEAAVALAPRLAASWGGLGDSHLALADAAAAEAAFRRATALEPRAAAAWNGLGLALAEQGRFEEAAECWRRAAALAPQAAEAWNNLGLALRRLGRVDEAVAALLEALARSPEGAEIRRNLAACLKNRGVATATPALRAALLSCLETPGVDTQPLLPAVLDALADGPARAALETLDEGDDGAFDAAVAGLAEEPLFLAAMEAGFVVRPQWERLLTRLRRRALLAPGTVPQATVVALAHQCFANEFVFWSEPEEEAEVARIAAVADATSGEETLARLAMYRPLCTVAGLAEATPRWSEAFARLVARSVEAPAEERRLAPAIAELAAADAADVGAVRAMYEENPYPRWVVTGRRTPRPAAAVLRSLFPDFVAPPALAGPVRVLIAGCGTGKQAIDAATRYSGARALAVDLSRASLAYAVRMARALGVDNISFRRGDLRAIGPEHGPFEIVECTGVLHHLGDKRAALDALRHLVGLLTPGGVIKLGLYSALARAHLAAATDFVAAGGYPADAEGIRRLRRDILALPFERPERRVLANRDFYALSPCRDLLFHVQAHAYTLPEIATVLEAVGLRFIGFELDNPEALARFRNAHPEAPALADLERWARFEQEQPETFAGMYQFWCQKTGSS